MLIKNEKLIPAVCYYGLHMVEGVAQYADPQTNSGEPYVILIGENCLKQMDASFAGKPVYVHHVEEVSTENVDKEAVGYVIESFFNKTDGKHWAKFLVTSTEGLEAIKRGWKLSNAYLPKSFAGGGKWHNVEYLKEVMEGEYEHLALVPNPRYEESIILTPEEFKAYNSEKELELQRLSNSKGENEMGFFTKKKVENAVEIENTSVVLKGGTEKTIKQLINEAEALEEHKKNEEKEKAAGKMPMANGEHMVKVGDDEMSVNALVEKYNELASKKNEEEKKEDDSDDKDVEKKDDDADDEKALDKAKEKKNEEKKEKQPEAKENEEDNDEIDEPKKDKKANSKHAETLRNAHLRDSEKVVELSQDQLERGKSRYGSGN